MNNKSYLKKGFTLAELVVAVAVFLVIIIGVYNAYKAVYDVVSVSRFKIVAVDLANERFEIIRNMPYSSVGTVSGIPNGVLNHEDQVTRDGQVFDITTTIRNYDDPFDGTLGGNPNDISPADSKIVEVRVDCQFCKSFKPIILSDRGHVSHGGLWEDLAEYRYHREFTEISYQSHIGQSDEFK
jgi:prepilin-type N-terminal cleavage/methylation domain-containing protein